MRTVLAVALMALVGCAGSLRHHAQAASATAQLLDVVGAEIEREAADDYAAVMRAPEGDRADRLAALKAHWFPVEVAHAAAIEAHGAYVKAIVDANAEGEKELAIDAGRALREALVVLSTAAERLGIHVPSAASLNKLGGDK